MSEFDQYFKKKKRGDAALAATTALTSPLVPDQFAYNRGLAKMLNVSTGVVSSAPEMFADKLKQKQDTESLLDAEKIRGWLLTPENAAIAADDIGSLTNFERISKSFQQADVNLIGRSQRVSRDVAASLETSRLGQMLDSASSTFDEKLLIGEDGKPNMLGRIANTFRRAGAESDGVPRSLVGGERVTLESRADAIGDKPLNTIGQMAARRAAQFDEDGFAPMRHQEVDSFGSAMMFIAENIAASAPQMAVSFASGGFAPLLNVSMFAGEVNDEMSERTDLSRDQRVAIAVSTGVAMSALEMFGLSKIFGDLLPGNIAMDAVNGVLADKIVKNGFSVAAAKTLQAGIAEGSTELLQEGLVIGVTALSGGRYKEGEILERLTASLIIGGAVGAGLRGSAAIPTASGKEFVRLLSKVNKTGQSAKTLSDVDAAASGSNLKTRAPDKFLEALEAAGLSEQDLYIPAQDVREYFQSQNLAEAEIERWGISPEIFAEKIASGGDIVMPISDYAAHISGTPDADWMRENAVLDPNEMSPAQALRFNEEAAKVFQDAFDEAVTAQEANDATRASDVQVFDAMQSELRAAGRSPDVAQNEARVWQSFWNSMAERYGEDPLDLARRFGVRVQGPNRDIVAGRRRGDLDIMLNTLRKGEPKATGQSLIPFLRSLGGLQDFGGDVAALGAPKGLVSATRADRDNRQTDFGGVPAPLPGVGLDVAARRAVEAGFFPDLLAQIADNSGLEGDLVAPLLESISENLSGNLSFIEGQGPDADLTALSAELDRAGVNIDDSNEVIIAALEAEAGIDAGDEYNQSGNLKTNTPEFKAWFGDSKVVDENGDPLVVYHGTAESFEAFDPERSIGGQYWFTTNKEAIEAGEVGAQGKGVTIDVYLSIKNPAGWAEYDKYGVDELISQGFDGMALIDDGQTTYVAFDPTQIKSVNNRGTFDPSDPRILFQDGDKKRGSIQFPRGGLAEGETVINLFEEANLSTFLHESGHFFLEAFTELAGQDTAPADMQADLQAIRDFVGVAPGEKFETEHHEKWARGFEAYTLEGKAPSLALADAFARFKSWLMRIYRSALDLNVKLTPEIRDVMDRMLATEEEIAEARESMSLKPLFTDQAPDGMADIDYKTYQRMAQRSVDQAEQRLLKKTMAKVKRSRETWFKTETAAVRLEVDGEINSRREHRLVEMLANKKWFGSDRDVPDMRIDRTQLVEMFGEGVIPEISRQKLGGKRAIYGTDGETPQGVATFFGFNSVTEMIETLQNTPKRLDAINLETDRRMTERYGDPLNDGSIEEDALLAIHADQQAATVIAEARHLNTRAGRPTSNTNAKVYRARARQMINDMPVRDVMRPDTFLNAERKAAREAEQSFAQVARNGRKSGEALERAAVAKERQLINHYLYREARDAQDWIGKGREKARSYAVKKTREKIGTGFIEQIDGILERFDFRVRSKKQVERSESLRDFVRRMTDEGREAELSISDKLLDESRRMHFTRLPVGELRGVFDTIDNLDHMGRFKRKLIDQKNKRDLDETVSKVTNALATNIGKKEPGRFKRKGDDRRKDARDYLNLTLNADTLLREVDGFADLGDAYTSIKQPIDEGMNRLTERRLQMANDLDEIYKVYDASTLREMSKKKSIAALGLEATQWEIISIALNTGNNDNYQRLTNPKTKGGFTEDQVNGALRELTEQDWRTVQSMWDYINGYWTEIAAKEKRTTGVVPTKVESKLMVEAPDFVKGGYYPIKYDSKLSGRATDMDQEALTQALMGGRHGKAQTANGHTKERALNVTMPLKLDLSVAHSHLAQVLYDLEIGEAVTNSWRVLQDSRTKDAFINSGKQSDHQALEIWLQDVAAGDRVSARGMEVGLRHLRSGFVVSRLALNISTALIQPTGLAQSAVVVGKRATAAGVVEFVKNPNRWVNEAMKASSFMRERQTTFERDIFNVVGDLESGPVTSRWAKFQRDIVLPMSFLMMQKTQFYVVDMPTWVGAYNKEIKQSADHEKALLYADRMVARSQGSGLMSDRGMLERGTTDKNSRQRELPRMLTALGSYMFAKGNVAYESTMKTSFRDPLEVMKWAVDMSLLFTFEAVLYSAVKGFGPEEDEDFAVWLLKETGFSAMSTVPILREISGGLQGFGSGGILGSTLDKAFIKPITQAQQGEYDKALVKSLVDMSGIWFHLPSSQTNTVLNAVFEDDMGVKKEIDPLAAIGVGTGRGNSLADYFMEGE